MRKGLALILVVGVLAVLAVLGSAFAVLSRLERKAASLRVQGAQALLLARSGLEDAQARLDAGQDPVYGGEDWDKDGSLNGWEPAQEVYRTGLLDTHACPVRQALRPSFFVKDPGSLGNDLKPAPKILQAEGRKRGYSGVLRAGTWTVRAVPAGGFHVNGGDPSVQSNPTTTSNMNTCLRRMFGVLAEAIDREDGAADGNPVARLDGERLISLRPSRGWASFEQIRDAALGGSRAKLDAFKDYLVLGAWTDKKVIAPNIHRGSENKCFRLISWMGLGNWTSPPAGNLWFEGDTRTSPDFECSPRTDPMGTGAVGGKLLGRAPVDLAWARTKRPALIALLGDLKGLFWQENAAAGSLDMLTDTLGYPRAVRLALDWTQPSDDCRLVADALMTTTSELRTWEQFSAFCDSLPFTDGTGPTMVTDLGQAKKDLLKANFNPNTDTNKFNPEDSLKKLIDKPDLLVHSVELNLSARSWRVSACGRASGRVPATRILTADTFPDRLCRLTTQGEFVAGILGSLDVAGDEMSPRAYGTPLYITPSIGTHTTFGHTLTGDLGVSLQSYPEPHTAPPAPWDGQLKLATIETADSEYVTSGTMNFLARFDDSQEADFSGAAPTGLALVPVTEIGSGDVNPLPASYSIWPDPYFTTYHANTLYPSGAQVEMTHDDADPSRRGSVPGWPAPGNLPPDHGVLSYWFKPVNDSRKRPSDTHGIGETRERGTTYFCASREPAGSNKTYLAVWGGDLAPLGGPSTGQGFDFFWQSRPTANPGPVFPAQYPIALNNVQFRQTPARDILSRWYLGTFFWDMKTIRGVPGGTDERSTRIYIDRGGAVNTPNRNTSWSWANQQGYALTGLAVDFRTFNSGPAAFYLAARAQASGTSKTTLGSTTFDEVAIYDFGLAPDPGLPNDGIVQTEALASQRYAAGRFYKESEYTPGAFRAAGGLPFGPGRRAGEWFSAPVPLGDVRIRSIAWSQIVPRGLKNHPVLPAPENTLEDSDPGDDARVVFELADSAGAAYLSDAYGKPLSSLFADPRGETVWKGDRFPRRLKAPFRLHAVFQPNLYDAAGEKENRAILDPLALDDVTVTYRPLLQPGLSVWSEGE